MPDTSPKGTNPPPRFVQISMKTLAVAALSSALLLSACDNQTVVQPSDSGSQTGMVVVGVGKVDVRPDTLVVSMGVESTAPTAPEALEAMTTSADRMIEAIRDAGVPPEDLQTVSLSVREVRPRAPIGLEAAAVEGVPPSPGFVGTQRLRVRIKDLESGGDVIEQAVEAAGPDARVFGMSLTVDDPDDAIAQARTLAVEDALATGAELAETAGVDLGEPVAIEEISAPDPASTFALDLPVPSVTDGATGGAIATADAATAIEPGVRTLDVRVQVRFEID